MARPAQTTPLKKTTQRSPKEISSTFGESKKLWDGIADKAKMPTSALPPMVSHYRKDR